MFASLGSSRQLPFSPLAKKAIRLFARVLFVTCAVVVSANGARAGVVDPAAWTTDGAVNAMVRSGSTLYVGGAFRNVGPLTGGGVPLSFTGLAPTAGFPRVDGIVTAVASDGAGGWFVGGTFTHIGSRARQNLAHIRSDLQVGPWNPGADGAVLAIAVTPTDVYVGGQFSSAGGATRPRLARLDRFTGAASAWTPSPNGAIHALATNGTRLWVGGPFTTVASTGRVGIASFDLASETLESWNPAATSLSATLTVDGLALANGYVYATGNFETIGGQTRRGAAALQPGSGLATAWNPNVIGGGVSILPVGNRVYLGGFFMSVGGSSRSALAAVDTAAGGLLPWNPNAHPQPGSPVAVLTLASLGDRIAAGGVFSSAGGVGDPYFAVLDTSAGLVSGSIPAIPSSIQALATQGSTLYVGGSFSIVGASPRSNIAAIDLTTNTVLPWAPDASHTSDPSFASFVAALASDATAVYAAVSFSDVTGTRSQVYAISRASAGRLWTDDASAFVNALTIDSGTLYAGGNFTFLGTGGANRLAALNPSNGATLPWNPSPDNTVYALLPTSGGLVAGGDFVNAGGQPRARLVQIDEATGLATSWNPGADGSVKSLAMSGSTLLTGGAFGQAGGQARARVAAIDLGTGMATAWNPGANGSVQALATDGTIVYAGGAFSAFGGEPALNLAGVLFADGSPSGWRADVWTGSVSALCATGTRLYAGGSFTRVDVEATRGLATLFDTALLGVRPSPRTNEGLLMSCAPSPMRMRSLVRLDLPAAASVDLRILDVTGRTIRVLARDQHREAGAHEFAIEGRSLSPGVYLVQAVAGELRASRRIVVLP